MGGIRGIFVTGAWIFSCLLYTMFTGTFAVYLVGAMPNESQPLPAIRRGNILLGMAAAPATGHGVKTHPFNILWCIQYSVISLESIT